MEYSWILVVLILSCTQLFVGGDKQPSKPASFLSAQTHQSPIQQLLVKPPKLNVSVLIKDDLNKQETLQEFLAKISELWPQQKPANPLDNKRE